MFYCDPCRKEKNWPGVHVTSWGPCEVCGNTTMCHDVPASDLPKSEAVTIYGRDLNRDLGMKLSTLNLMPGDKIRAVSGAHGHPIAAGACVVLAVVLSP